MSAGSPPARACERFSMGASLRRVGRWIAPTVPMDHATRYREKGGRGVGKIPKRPRPERGAEPPSESERGWGPASNEKCKQDEARRTLAWAWLTHVPEQRVVSC